MLHDYVKLFAEVYRHELFNIVDVAAKINYLSVSLKKLLNISSNDEALQGNIDFTRTRKINKQIIEGGRSCSFFSAGKFNNKSHAFKISKYPIYHPVSERVIGVFSLIRNAQIVNWDDSASPQLESLQFGLEDDKDFSQIDELILFYASIGYTQGEIYHLITHQERRHISLNGFKYYYNRLLDKTQSSALSDIINNNSYLKKRCFVPNGLIKANALII